ncbi:MAG TPA: hypothetical protein VFG21_05555 [Xanthomonadaceae bacterium]|nr:hypothetical protein [Xanthomonadaceae bacterium]
MTSARERPGRGFRGGRCDDVMESITPDDGKDFVTLRADPAPPECLA